MHYIALFFVQKTHVIINLYIVYAISHMKELINYITFYHY